MAAVTQRISNYLGGISKQSDDQILQGQVTDCRNAYPDPTFGLSKRPGFGYEFTFENTSNATIATPTFNNSFWFTIYRKTSNGNRKPYFGCITPATSSPSANGAIYLWDVEAGTAVTITDNSAGYLNVLADTATNQTPVNDYHALSDETSVIITNKRKVVTAIAADTSETNIAGTQSTYASLIQNVTSPATNAIYRILNSDGDKDDYYLKWTGSAWEEVRAPDISAGLTASTMPHELVITDSAATFGPITWTARAAGDDTTNPMPSFVGKKLNASFNYQNRFGVLSEDNLIMSRAGINERYNFFRKSALVYTDGDQMDIKTSSTKPAHLTHCLPQANGLLLFSTNNIYVLYSDSGVLSPLTYRVRSLSAVEIDEDIMPEAMGSDVIFINKTLSYARAVAVTTQGYQENSLVRDFSKTVQELLPSNINRLVTNSQSERVAMYATDSSEIFLYSTYDPGDQDQIRAWYIWDTPGTIKHLDIWRDQLYAVIEIPNPSGTGYYVMLTARMTRSSINTISTEGGIKANPHIDMFFTPTVAAQSTTNEYLSRINFPFTNYLTDETPTLIMVDDGNPLTHDSGLIRDAKTVTSTYIEVSDPGGYIRTNLSRARIGYKFAMDIKLPKIYFTLGEGIVDTTAQLTVSRCKFNVGRTGSCGFKVHSRGQQQNVHTGDGSKTTFPITFNFQDASSSIPSDVSRIKVAVDGVTKVFNVDYTISVTRDVVFTSAPADKSNITFVLKNEVYTIYEVPVADQYQIDSAALGGQTTEKRMFTVPIHQKNDNFFLSVFSETPLPVSINSMAWEGIYSPRFYARS